MQDYVLLETQYAKWEADVSHLKQIYMQSFELKQMNQKSGSLFVVLFLFVLFDTGPYYAAMAGLQLTV